MTDRMVSVPEAVCTCGRINIGMKVTEHRNWSPDCPKHGTSVRNVTASEADQPMTEQCPRCLGSGDNEIYDFITDEVIDVDLRLPCPVCDGEGVTIEENT